MDARGTGPSLAAEAGVPVAASTLACVLIGRLLPGADASLLVSALQAERQLAAAGESTSTAPETRMSPGQRELRRVREQFVLGDAARNLQHALNNPLAALLAEAQLLEAEPMAGEHREAIVRIIDLARRVVGVARRLDSGTARIG